MDKKGLAQYALFIGKKGGYATLHKYGKKHYRRMANIRWAKVASKKTKK